MYILEEKYPQSDIIVYEKRHCGKRLCADVQLNFDIIKTVVKRDSPLQEWCKKIVRNTIQKSNFTLSNLGFPLLGNKKTLSHCIPFKSLIHMMYLNHDQCTIFTNNKSVCQTSKLISQIRFRTQTPTIMMTEGPIMNVIDPTTICIPTCTLSNI